MKGDRDRVPRVAVLTPTTLRLLASSRDDVRWFRDPMSLPMLPLGHVVSGGCVFLVGDSDVSDDRIVCFSLRSDGSLLGDEPTDREYESVVERIAQFCARVQGGRSVQLPRSWFPSKRGDRYAFGAAPIAQNSRHLRCVARVDELRSAIAIVEFVPDERALDLSSVAIDEELAHTPRSAWSDALDRGRQAVNDAHETLDSDRRMVTIDSPDRAGRRPARSFADWDQHLTGGQRSFLENDGAPNLILRGPAGSGKTLTLELKALREVYSALDRGASARVLFATHSWASTGQVEEDLRSLDRRGVLDEIEVMPVSALADDLTPSGAWRPEGMTLLGDDSYESKLLQTMAMSDILDGFLSQDWPTFEPSTSAEFRRRLASTDELERSSLLDDLLTEFGCVLAAENIFRGRDALAKYLALPRGGWMMPLMLEGDRRVVFELYQSYLAYLRSNSFVTTDILMSEFYKYLQGPAWDIERERRGFDLVLVDEVHLFNVQERMALRSLMSDPNAFPRLCVAMDLRQSPRVRRDVPGEAELITESIELDVVHRYSPEILQLVRHIHDFYPTLDLGDDWRLDLDVVQSSAGHGPKPILHLVEGFGGGVSTAAMARANSLREGGGHPALLVLDDRLFTPYAEMVKDRSDVSVITSRDDLPSLQHSRRRIVLGLAEHVAGLQFEDVLVAGLPEALVSAECPAYSLRTALTLLYLACSRAERRLEIFVDRGDAVPEVLSLALQSHVLEVDR